MRTRVSKRGQVSVPSDVRKKLHIEPDTLLEWVVEGETARVIPLPPDPIRAFRGSGRGVSVKSLLRSRRRDKQRDKQRDKRRDSPRKPA